MTAIRYKTFIALGTLSRLLTIFATLIKLEGHYRILPLWGIPWIAHQTARPQSPTHGITEGNSHEMESLKNGKTFPNSIAVVGAGYVGLTTAVCLSELGYDVCCYENEINKIKNLKNGISPISEPNVEELLRSGLKSKKLTIAIADVNLISTHDIVIICLPTPQSVDGHPDLRILNQFIDELFQSLNRQLILVIKSTVPVGTTERISSKLSKHGTIVVSNPEFLREGRAVYDFFHPDRVVIGTDDADAAESLADIYSSIDTHVHRCDSKSAELIKYASNCYLAMRLSFVNSIATISSLANANASSVLKGIGLDTRIGSEFLSPGPGWGGSCFPKDTAALIAIANDLGFQFKLMKATVESNDDRINSVADQVIGLLNGSVSNKVIAILGLTFKAGTDDMRDSPALRVIETLCSHGARIKAYDPIIKNKVSERFELSTSVENACQDAELILILTEWDEFRECDPVHLGRLVAQKKIFDTRDIVDKKKWVDASYMYFGLGH